MRLSVDTRPATTPAAQTLVVQRTSTGPLALERRRMRDVVLAKVLGSSLDAKLGSGVAPESGRLLAARAAQLVEPRERGSLADDWDEVLLRARAPRRVHDPRVPVARGAVIAAAAEISELARALRSASPVAARDVARARALLTDARSPVYRGGPELAPTLARLVADLTRTALSA